MVQHPGVINVYVIRLSSDVLSDPRFVAANPEYVRGKPCYYVGESVYEPEVRFRQHKDGAPSNRLVRRYGLRVVASRCRKVYTTDTCEAQAREAEYADELRTQGYGVWQK